MKCDRYWEALSARLDDEAPTAADSHLDAHLNGCAACRRRLDAAVAATRRLRIRAAAPTPDLSARIMAALPEKSAAPRPGRALPTLRWLLGGVAFVQLTLGLAQLLGVDRMSMVAMTGDDHLFNESTAWNLAVAAGLATAAIRPGLVRGFLPVLGVFALVLTAVSVGDVVSGRVGAARLASHVFIVLGLVLLVLIDRHNQRIPEPGRSDAARLSDDDILALDDPVTEADGSAAAESAGRWRGLRPAGRRAA